MLLCWTRPSVFDCIIVWRIALGLGTTQNEITHHEMIIASIAILLLLIVPSIVVVGNEQWEAAEC